MDDQLQQLRQRIIRTVTRRIGVGFVAAVLVIYGVQVARGVVDSVTDVVDLGLLTQNLILAQLLVLGWLFLSFLMNPLGGRYLRLLASSPASIRSSAPVPGSSNRIEELGLPGLRPVATLTTGDDEDNLTDVYQTADANVTVVLEDGALTALSRLDDGRIFMTTDLMVVPCSKVLINLKTDATPAETIESHLRMSRKLSSFDLSVTPDTASIALEVLDLERQALCALGPVAGVFLGLHGSARPHRLLVAPTRQDLVTMGLAYKQNPSGTSSESGPVTPWEHNSVASTDFNSNEMMVSSSSS